MFSWLRRILKKPEPERPQRRPLSPSGRTWTEAEDRLILSVGVMGVKNRWARRGEGSGRALAERLGRSETSIRTRRYRLRKKLDKEIEARKAEHAAREARNAEIERLVAQGVPRKELAERYGISVPLVYRIVERRRKRAAKEATK